MDQRERIAERAATIRARHPQLATRLAAAGDGSNPHKDVCDGVLLHCLVRGEEMDKSPLAETWTAFTDQVLPALSPRDWHVRSAVYANSIALLALATAQDYVDFVELVESTGARKVAAIQSTLDEALESPPGLPLVTSLTRALARRDRVERLLIEQGRSARGAHRAAKVVYQGTHWLLMADVRANQSAPLLRSADELRSLVADGNVAQWRLQLSAIASGPWGPHGERLIAFADEADLPAVRMHVEQTIRYYKKRHEKAEKEAVAREIQRLVRLSGVTQRDFAKYIGTSASRLSTYANGVVTPSAAMLLRIRRTAETLSEATNASAETPAVDDDPTRA